MTNTVIKAVTGLVTGATILGSVAAADAMTLPGAPSVTATAAVAAPQVEKAYYGYRYHYWHPYFYHPYIYHPYIYQPYVYHPYVYHSYVYRPYYYYQPYSYRRFHHY